MACSSIASKCQKIQQRINVPDPCVIVRTFISNFLLSLFLELTAPIPFIHSGIQHGMQNIATRDFCSDAYRKSCQMQEPECDVVLTPEALCDRSGRGSGSWSTYSQVSQFWASEELHCCYSVIINNEYEYEMSTNMSVDMSSEY
jgi:hypothetical protein